MYKLCGVAGWVVKDIRKTRMSNKFKVAQKVRKQENLNYDSCILDEHYVLWTGDL